MSAYGPKADHLGASATGPNMAVHYSNAIQTPRSGREGSLIKRKQREPDTRKAEYQAAERKLDRREAETPAPRVVVNSRYYPNESLDMERLVEAFGTEDRDSVNGLAQQLIFVGARLNLDALSFMIAVIKGIRPNDQIEAMLAAQMAATHVTMMAFTRRLAHAEDLPHQDSAERTLNKLARTFTTQMQVLKRYRTADEQKVTVQRVSVKAIVGNNISQAAHEDALEKPANATHALTDARQPAMEIIREPARAPVPARRRQKDDGQSSA
jgi:hypothetical protein